MSTATGSGNENRKKGDRFRLAKQQLCTCITLFVHFFCYSTTKTWKYIISRFLDDMNTRKRLSFSFPELWYSVLKFNSSKIRQHLTNWTRQSKRDKVWSSANSLSKQSFRSRRRFWCLSSLVSIRRTCTPLWDVLCWSKDVHLRKS